MQTNIELKARAKRLKTAIQDVLGVAVSTSQSLELVAKEENYPNWDAASGCSLKPVGASVVNNTLHFDPPIAAAIIAAANPTGGLILVAGLTAVGTTTAALAIKRLIESAKEGASVAHIEDALRDNRFAESRPAEMLALLEKGVTVVSEISASTNTEHMLRAMVQMSEQLSEKVRLVLHVQVIDERHVYEILPIPAGTSSWKEVGRHPDPRGGDQITFTNAG